jgi:hypothetical protein
LWHVSASGVEGKVQCEVCRRYYHAGSLRRHVRNQHQTAAAANTAQCHICCMHFKNEGVMKDHMRRKHNVYLSKAAYADNSFAAAPSSTC